MQSALAFFNLYTTARTLAQKIDDARDVETARLEDLEELAQQHEYLENLNESAEDSIPVEEMQMLAEDIATARHAWSLANDRLQILISEREELSARLEAVRLRHTPDRLSSFEYDQQQEREDREYAAAQAMQHEPVTPWWLTVSV